MIDDGQIETCLLELNLLGTNESIGPEDSLFDKGIIDSLGIATLVTSLTARYGIVVPDEDLLPDNFDSISSIARYVNGKLGFDKRGEM